jgi:ribosomal protein L18
MAEEKVFALRYPFGDAVVFSGSATGAQAVTPQSGLTVIDLATTEATGNRTINLTLPASGEQALIVGSLIYLKSKTNGTETTIFGTGMTAVTVTGTAGKTKVQQFIYDGSTFKPTGASVQID